MPPVNELHYFDRPPKYIWPNLLSESSLPKRIQNPKWVFRALYNSIAGFKHLKWYYNWYLSLFKDLKKCKDVITPTYPILKEQEIAKMSNLLGRDTKIIFMLRNPIESAWSIYKYRFYKQQNSKRQFKEPEEFLRYDYHVLRSQYSKTIQLY